MNDTSLSGVAVVVTRAIPQARTLLSAIEDRDGNPVALPLLEIIDADDGGQALNDAVVTASEEDWLVVLSPNCARRLPPGPFRGQVAAIAAGTSDALRAAGYAVDLMPQHASSLGVLEAFEDVEINGSVIVAQAQNGRKELVEGLRRRGVDVDVVIAYRNVLPVIDAADVERAVAADIVVFASPSAVSRYVDNIGVAPIRAVCIGATTARDARAKGFDVTVAESTDLAAIVRALEGVAAQLR